MPTAKSHAELVRDVEGKIKAQSFFSARVAQAHILERLRKFSDGYSRGEYSLGEARNILKDFLKGEGYDPKQAGMKNLASTGRVNLVLRQNSSMCHAAAEWKRMHDPDAMKVFPYVRYHCRGDRKTRSSHAELDGKIFHKDDPFLKTHTPPWEFNCRCYLEEITAKEAGKHEDKIQEVTPADQVKVESQSGFSFDPEHFFEEFDISSSITEQSRSSILKQAENAVRDQKLGSVGLIVAPAVKGVKTIALPAIDKVEKAFDAMKDAARSELENAGLDPEYLPDYQTVNRVIKDKLGKSGENIPGKVLTQFPKEPFEVTKLCRRVTEAAGLPQDIPLMLGKGNSHQGIEHLWQHHKDLFVDPQKAVRLLEETLGNENCRVVVSLKRGMETKHLYGSKVRKPSCLKRIVLHNPQKKTYCVMVYDGKELKLVSWHNANEDYGNKEWSLG